MNDQPPSGGLSTPALIRLQRDRAGTILASPNRDEPDAFRPFLLPSFPVSLHFFLGGLVKEFNSLHHRCLAVLLVLECLVSRWLPSWPTQRV